MIFEFGAPNQNFNIMKFFYSIAFCLLCAGSIIPAQAQNTEIFIPAASSNTLVRLHFFSFGMGLEQAVAPKVSVFMDLTYGSDYNQETEEFKWVPYLSFEPRYYFNLDRRAAGGKKTDFFSGQFVTFQTKVGLPIGGLESWYSLTPMWGFQYAFGKRAYASFQIGPGLYGSSGELYSDLNGDFSIGFVL